MKQFCLSDSDIQGRRFLLLGFGKNHEAIAPWLQQRGALLTVRDTNPEALARAEALLDIVTTELLPVREAEISGFDYVLRSPGVPLSAPAIVEAMQKGTLITSQTDIFLGRCPATVIAVTGTKGKGTTCSLLTACLQSGYGRGEVFLGGNIGVDPFTFLDRLNDVDLVVLELSSFQLDGLQNGVEISVMLHVSTDHIEHHGSLEAYRAAKGRLLQTQEESGSLAILNAQYEEYAQYSKLVRAEKILTYHIREPRRQGAWVDSQGGRDIVFFHFDEKIDSFDVTERKLLGRHNLENILPAALAAAYLGVETNVIARCVNQFTGLPHRISLVEGTVDGLVAYDDSIATTPDASVVSLQALKGKGRVHLVLGGVSKGYSLPDSFYDEVVAIASHVYVLPGQLREQIVSQLSPRISTTLLTIDADNAARMGDLAEKIRRQARPGDCVLLAPAAASDVPYKNYAERGDAFQVAVKMVTLNEESYA